MSSGIGELTAHLSIDTSEFVKPIEEAARASEESGDRIIKVIHEQDATWRAMVNSVSPAINELASVIIKAGASVLALRNHQLVIRGVKAALGEANISLQTYLRLGLTVGAQVIPPLKAVALAVTAATVAYKVGTSEMVQASFRQSEVGQKLFNDFDRLSGATERTGDAMSRMANTALEGAQEALSQFSSQVVDGAMVLVKYTPVIQLTMQLLDGTASAMEWVATKAEGFEDIMSTVKFQTESLGMASEEATAKFYEEGKALEAMAKETERVIALQEGHRNSYKSLREIQEGAIESAKNAAEVAKVGSLTSVAAIEAEIRALQERAGAAIRAGKPIDDAHLKNMFGALENQKQGVLAGKITPDTIKKSAPEQMVADSQKALDRLNMSEVDFATAQARAAGATAEQITQLRENILAVNALKDAKSAHEEAERAMIAAQEAAQQKMETGAQHIQSLKDQIDLMTGAATEGEIAMRNMLAGGFDEEQAAQVAELTDELNRLKEEEKPGKKGREAENTAILKGSAKAAELMIRGQTSGPDKKEELQKKQNALTQQLITRVDRGFVIEVEEVTLPA